MVKYIITDQSQKSHVMELQKLAQLVVKGRPRRFAFKRYVPELKSPQGKLRALDDGGNIG